MSRPECGDTNVDGVDTELLQKASCSSSAGVLRFPVHPRLLSVLDYGAEITELSEDLVEILRGQRGMTKSTLT